MKNKGKITDLARRVLHRAPLEEANLFRFENRSFRARQLDKKKSGTTGLLKKDKATIEC